MKKTLLLLAAFLLLASCGKNAQEEMGSLSRQNEKDGEEIHCPESLDIGAFDLSGVKSVRIASGYTGADLLVTGAEDIAAIIEKASVLSGSDPISSRGYYGWSYGLDFYETENPAEDEEPMLRFAMFDCSSETTYLTYGTFEINNGHRYSAMYLTDAALTEEMEILCASLIGEESFYSH
ncbi:MAG: hypothetical protein IJC71_04985 [Clostridia bacterium]|nr:hypothetical protein [Clostridia bacterium]